jgi:hypothetical protein
MPRERPIIVVCPALSGVALPWSLIVATDGMLLHHVCSGGRNDSTVASFVPAPPCPPTAQSRPSKAARPKKARAVGIEPSVVQVSVAGLYTSTVPRGALLYPPTT